MGVVVDVGHGAGGGTSGSSKGRGLEGESVSVARRENGRQQLTFVGVYCGGGGGGQKQDDVTHAPPNELIGTCAA